MPEEDPRIERTRTRVIEATLDLLMEEGADGLSHQRVAERAAVGRATVYRHWPERWDLLREAVESLSMSVVSPPGLGLREGLIAMLEELCERLASPAGGAFAFLIAQAEQDSRAGELLARVAGHATGEILKLLERKRTELGFHLDVPERSVVSQIAGPYFFERFVLGRIESREGIPAHVDALLDRWGIPAPWRPNGEAADPTARQARDEGPPAAT